jgi:hypothetical protein
LSHTLPEANKFRRRIFVNPALPNDTSADYTAGAENSFVDFHAVSSRRKKAVE